MEIRILITDINLNKTFQFKLFLTSFARPIKHVPLIQIRNFQHFHINVSIFCRSNLSCV